MHWFFFDFDLRVRSRENVFCESESICASTKLFCQVYGFQLISDEIFVFGTSIIRPWKSNPSLYHLCLLSQNNEKKRTKSQVWYFFFLILRISLGLYIFLYAELKNNKFFFSQSSKFFPQCEDEDLKNHTEDLVNAE